MIRPVTCLCLLAACGTGAYLYSEKHRTALLDRDIGRVIHATEAAHARTGILRAEWALLNEPGRLQDIAGRYLTLHPMAPTQFVQVAELSAHLPAAVAPQASELVDEDEAAPTPVLAANVSPPQDVAGLPAHHPMQPQAKADAHAGQKLLAKADMKHAPHHTMLADRAETSPSGLRPMGTPLPLASPQPMGARVYSAIARPMHMAPPPRIVSAVPSFAPSVSSVLGGAGSLPPPVPYGR